MKRGRRGVSEEVYPPKSRTSDFRRGKVRKQDFPSAFERETAWRRDRVLAPVCSLPVPRWIVGASADAFAPVSNSQRTKVSGAGYRARQQRAGQSSRARPASEVSDGVVWARGRDVVVGRGGGSGGSFGHAVLVDWRRGRMGQPW